MNYMKDIAKLLGVEFDEEFYLKSTLNGKYCSSGKNKTTFKLSDSGMQMKFVHNHDYEWCSIDAILAEILTGSQEIVKKPWRPKDKEFVYYIELNRSITRTWFNAKGGVTLLMYSLGNCFKTEEEITPEVLEETWQKCYGVYFQDDKQDGAQQ